MSMSGRLLRPRATGFNPRSIANLALWLDASDSSSITTSTGVSIWADKSGNGRNATQAVAAKQPLYSSTLNGRNVISFQGVDDTMQVAANAAFNAASQTIFVVAKQTTAGNQALWYKADSNSAEGVIMRYRTGTTFWLYQRNDGVSETIASNSVTNSNANVFSLVLQPSSQAGWVNGSAANTATLVHTYDNNSGPWIGSRRDIGEYLIADVAEVIHYSAALTTSQRQTVERYLGRKWGVTVA